MKIEIFVMDEYLKNTLKNLFDIVEFGREITASSGSLISKVFIVSGTDSAGRSKKITSLWSTWRNKEVISFRLARRNNKEIVSVMFAWRVNKEIIFF